MKERRRCDFSREKEKREKRERGEKEELSGVYWYVPSFSEDGSCCRTKNIYTYFEIKMNTK